MIQILTRHTQQVDGDKTSPPLFLTLFVALGVDDAIPPLLFFPRASPFHRPALPSLVQVSAAFAVKSRSLDDEEMNQEARRRQ